MTRTKLSDRILPNYTGAEEIFHMVSHIVGAALGIIALILCTVFSAIYKDAWAVVGCAIYGAALILLYTTSSIYHGLRHPMAKKVFQVLDHCTIYFLIGGTYTPILFTAIRDISKGWAWAIFGIVWGLAALATVFTAIDLKKYKVLSMVCYIGMGWCIVLSGKTVIEALPVAGFLWLLGGGIAYTIGAVLYGLGKRHRYMHAIFHVFCVIGSVMQFVCIFWYIILW